MDSLRFMTSLLTFYMKGEIKFEQNFVKLKIPNTILALIPLGAHNQTISVAQIASVSTNFKLFFKSFLVGIIAAFIGLMFVGDENSSTLFGLVLLIVGVGMVISSFQTALVIDTTSGESLILFFLIFEKSKAMKAADHINNLISQRLDDTNTRVHTENQTEAVVEAINSLKK